MNRQSIPKSEAQNFVPDKLKYLIVMNDSEIISRTPMPPTLKKLETESEAWTYISEGFAYVAETGDKNAIVLNDKPVFTSGLCKAINDLNFAGHLPYDIALTMEDRIEAYREKYSIEDMWFWPSLELKQRAAKRSALAAAFAKGEEIPY